jgi:hypothetical protein
MLLFELPPVVVWEPPDLVPENEAVAVLESLFDFVIELLVTVEPEEVVECISRGRLGVGIVAAPFIVLDAISRYDSPSEAYLLAYDNPSEAYLLA